MKKAIILFILLLFSGVIKPQDNSQSNYKIDSFCSHSGNIVKGSILYTAKSSSFSFPDITLLELNEEGRNDTSYKILIHASIAFDQNYTRPFNIFLDYNEVKRILDWIEVANQEISSNSSIDYIAYHPISGKMLMYVIRPKKNSDWQFWIQYDESDIFSLTVFQYHRLNDLKSAMEEIEAFMMSRLQ